MRETARDNTGEEDRLDNELAQWHALNLRIKDGGTLGEPIENVNLNDHSRRSDECTCLPTFDPGGLGCFECWLAGYETTDPRPHVDPHAGGCEREEKR